MMIIINREPEESFRGDREIYSIDLGDDLRGVY